MKHILLICVSVIILSLAPQHTRAAGEEEDIVNAIINADIRKTGSGNPEKIEDSQTSASHGSAYKSIIGNYYNNDPSYGSSSAKKYASKNEALQRLKKILKKRKIENDQDIKMERDQTIHRSMIPAPLLARAKHPNVAEERHEDYEGIPAPLLAGGAFRVRNHNNRVLKKTLEVEEVEQDHSKPFRIHIKKVRKPE